MTPQKQKKSAGVMFKCLLHLLLPSAGQPAEYDQTTLGPDLATAASLPCPRAAMPASVVMSFMHGRMVELTHGREN